MCQCQILKTDTKSNTIIDMDKLVEAVTKAPKTRSKNDDDFADRLSSRYTVVLLIVFAVLVGIIEVRVDSKDFRYQSDSCIATLYSLYS